jgi:predicted DNA binding CopG/RHH family protein
MATKVRIPRFKSEEEEATWWDSHPEVITRLFLQAKKEGKLKRLSATRGVTESITIRLAVNDLEAVRELAEKRGLPYQTYMKMLLHQALEKERRSP